MGYTYSTDIGTGQVNNELERKYINTHSGTESIEVTDEALTSIEACDERAESVFLDQSYIQSIVTLSTYHRDGLKIGDVVSLDNILYKIESIDESCQGAKAEITINMKRWD